MVKIREIINSESFVQLVKYVLIGILGLVVDFGIYTILTYFKVNIEIANIISSTCGIINNFFWNSYTNFKVHDHLIVRFISYFLVGQITTVFTTLSLFIFVNQLGYPHLIVKIVATFVATLIQFIINKIITFKKVRNNK
ncbi:GtrA family protein [Lactobacillus helveticus]|uniref:GtrA-like protein n=2 Tax=Lactobacillus helveticus TaxID=1587 RepID=A0A3S8SAS2_LACHE|nr:GtrA family protein [Lactobacillus helveticus]AFR22333.1 GtrA-like protein [Lactobacillus helveticus R0052]AZK90993.1 GtrA-like protein [Lactobacillus helveticus]MCJ2190649.1 GtrA family protein [Lactobacillus helveticus]MED7627786.1 GtrA family protein [Lactobacillus helveticus]MZR05374.1 GtrA family protein [Lactobacillus helveticus]